MKKIFLLLAVFSLVQFTRAQWDPEIRPTDALSSSNLGFSCGAHAIAASGDSIHVVWSDNRDGNNEIYYKRSVDGGLSWGDNIRLTNEVNRSISPSIVVSGSFVHVVWSDNRDGDPNYEIYYKSSGDGGVSWTSDIRLSNTAGYSYHPSLAVSGSNLFMVFYDYCDNWWEIYYMRSTNGGLTWESPTRLTADINGSYAASVCVSGTLIHVTWHDNRDGNNEIYYKRSLNRGISWEADIRLTNNDSESWKSCVGTSGTGVYVVWSDNRDGNYEIYFKRSADGGLTWGSDTRLTNNSGESMFPNIAVTGPDLFVVWRDESDGNREIYYKNSIDGGLSWGPAIRLTNDPAASDMAYISTSGSKVHVVWDDNRDGQNEIYYKNSSDKGASWGTDKRLTTTTNSLALWDPDVRLTNSPGSSLTSDNNAWCIASNGDTLYATWYDNRDGNSELYFKRSTNRGTTWGTDTRLTFNASGIWGPSIAVTGALVHIVWFDDRDGVGEIYYKRSADGGATWGADTRLTYAVQWSEFPSMAVSGDLVHVVWTDSRDGALAIYYKRSTDGGITWEPDTRLTSNTAYCGFPSVAAFGSVVHVLWEDQRDGQGEIYYRRSVDGGINWEAETRITNNNFDSWDPSVAVVGLKVHVVWMEKVVSGNYEIFYTRSPDGGNSWEPQKRLSNNIAASEYPCVAANGSGVHVVWEDKRDGQEEIYYQTSSDGGTNWLGPELRLTNSPGIAKSASVCMSGSNVNVLWSDSRNINYEIYYKRKPSGNVITGSERDKPGSSASLVRIYPNPASTSIHIVTSANEKTILSIRNMLGKELINRQISKGETVIDVSTLQNGIYLTSLILHGKRQNTAKLIIAK